MAIKNPDAVRAGGVLQFPNATPRARKEDLAVQDQTLLLETVLGNLSQGVSMFDAGSQLVFCNQRYIDMYGLSAEFVKPGCALADILKHCVAVGSFSGNPDEFIDKIHETIAAGKSRDDTLELGNGRAFAVVTKPLEGGGWLTTHEDVTKRQRADGRIAHMARHDALTNLPNRVLLRERLEYELKRVGRGGSLAVLYLDLDHFKTVNDTLGHPIGDGLLKVVAERLRHCLRDADTVARLGGDEFAIIMTGVEQPTDAAALSRRVRESITKPYEIDGHQIVADISIGISIAPSDGTDPDHLLKNADMALYGAKADGRGLYRFFEPEMDARAKVRRDLEMDLRKALAANEFELFYQPLVNLKNNEITGFEALLRWNHPKRGMVSPADFIPIAEETGLIIPIGEWVMKTACNQSADWPDELSIAVNLSPVQFKAKNLVEVVKTALEDANMAPDRLQLEITESILMKNTFATLQTLHKLRELGVKIAMDDFGTGYSSLSYLRSFPFDKIKIDRSFVNDLSKGVEPLAIVSAVATLANNLSMTSTAEGVETQEQLTTLQSVGCTEMQGYFFSRALPANEIRELIKSKKTKGVESAA